METEHALIQLAHEVQEAPELRERALGLLCATFEADVGICVATDGGREVRSLRGLSSEAQRRLADAWEGIRADVAPVKAEAQRVGAATDRDVLGARLPQTTLYRRVMQPVGGIETLFIVPSLGGRPLGLLALGRRRGSFSTAALAHARGLVPALSVASRAMASRLEPLPELTETELDLLDYLELGWGTREIARARGTSFFTVRNQLSVLYRRLEVSNRAEAIGLRRRAGAPMGRATHRAR